jgi:hypothetical protein
LKAYYYANIKDFSFEIPEKRTIKGVWESSPWVNGGERFAFEYFGKVKRFGRKLDEREAKLLNNLLQSKMKLFSK